MCKIQNNLCTNQGSLLETSSDLAGTWQEGLREKMASYRKSLSHDKHHSMRNIFISNTMSTMGLVGRSWHVCTYTQMFPGDSLHAWQLSSVQGTTVSLHITQSAIFCIKVFLKCIILFIDKIIWNKIKHMNHSRVRTTNVFQSSRCCKITTHTHTHAQAHKDRRTERENISILWL